MASTENSLREKVLLDLVATLKKIKTANGHRLEVADTNISRLLVDPSQMNPENFPSLFVTDGPETMKEGTNREVFSQFVAVIIGYVRYNKDADSDNIPSVQLNQLIADVKEAVMDTTNPLFVNNNTSNVHIDSVETDQGFLEPDAVFEMEVRMETEYGHDDTSRSIQT